MFLAGLAIGLIVGGFIATLLFAPLVDQLNQLEELGWKHRRELEAMNERITGHEQALHRAQRDFVVLSKMAPAEVLERFFDSPSH